MDSCPDTDIDPVIVYLGKTLSFHDDTLHQGL